MIIRMLKNFLGEERFMNGIKVTFQRRLATDRENRLTCLDKRMTTFEGIDYLSKSRIFFLFKFCHSNEKSKRSI